MYPNGGPGRPSIRLTSNNNYTHGLFVIDLAHMPFGCGTWPAFWTFGPNWPNNGEIGTLVNKSLMNSVNLTLITDIIEGVNLNTVNSMTLHCSPNCTIAGSGMTGILQTNNCAYYPGYNVGCGITANTSLSYGVGFNNNGGGNLKILSLDSNTLLNQTRCLCDGVDLKLHSNLVFSSWVCSKQRHCRNAEHNAIWGPDSTF